MQEQQNECKRQRWLMLDTKLLQNMLDEQLEQVNSLPPRSHNWDVHIGMLDSIVDMQVHLTLRNISRCNNKHEQLHATKFARFVFWRMRNAADATIRRRSVQVVI